MTRGSGHRDQRPEGEGERHLTLVDDPRGEGCGRARSTRHNTLDHLNGAGTRNGITVSNVDAPEMGLARVAFYLRGLLREPAR